MPTKFVAATNIKVNGKRIKAGSAVSAKDLGDSSDRFNDLLLAGSIRPILGDEVKEAEENRAAEELAARNAELAAREDALAAREGALQAREAELKEQVEQYKKDVAAFEAEQESLETVRSSTETEAKASTKTKAEKE